MRIYQRTGENTGVSYGLGTALFGVCVIASVAGHVVGMLWPVLVILAAIYVAFLLMRRYGERSAPVERLAQRFRERR